MTNMDLLDVGLMGYDQALDIQMELHRQCSERLRPDVLLLQQNQPVITLGRDTSPEHLLWGKERLKSAGIGVRSVMRGGDITYHGPGQLIASPIMHFRNHTDTALNYLRMLEQTVIGLLAAYGIQAGRIEGKSGVWVGCDKIAAVGLHISRSVTMHGIALNICPDISHFEAIIPCGLADVGVTSLQLLGIEADFNEVKAGWLRSFCAVFGVRLTNIETERYD